MKNKLDNKNFKVKFGLTLRIFALYQEIMEKLTDLKYSTNLHFYPQLRRRSHVMSVHSTCKIENNSLSVEQVTDIIDNKRVMGPRHEILEVQNAHAAYNQIDYIDPYSFEHLLYIHSIMARDLVDTPGQLRTGNVYIRSEIGNKGKTIYTPPSASEVPALMNQLFYWINNNPQVPPIIKSCVFHYYFECIHPFDDCNGRIGRLWQLAMLNKFNHLFKFIPIEEIVAQKQDEYYNTFASENQDYDCTKFIEFMLEAILDQIINLASDTKKDKPNYPSDIDHMLKLMVNESYSPEELMKLLKVKTRYWLIIRYLQPALKLGLIEMTIPDKPTSKNQRYRKVRQ